MSQSTDLALRRWWTDWRTLVFLIGVTGLGMALMIAGERTASANHPVWRALLLGWADCS